MVILKSTKENIEVASDIVKSGGLVIFPTETVYGLGCDPLNTPAVKRLIKVKGNRNKPLPIIASTIKDVEKIAFISSKGKKLATHFWPGPLTMVFPKKSIVPTIVTFNCNSIGVRISSNKVALELITLSDGLLIGSSANRTGIVPPREINEIPIDLKESVDVILDAGPIIQGGLPSTVVDLTSDKIKILREGPIKLKTIMEVLESND